MKRLFADGTQDERPDLAGERRENGGIGIMPLALDRRAALGARGRDDQALGKSRGSMGWASTGKGDRLAPVRTP